MNRKLKMEYQSPKANEFVQKIKAFDPNKSKNSDEKDLLLFYYYNLEYSGRREEEHKLSAWNLCIKDIFEIERKLFMSTGDLIVSLAYKIEDEAKLSPIIKNLKLKHKFVSSREILEGIGKNVQK